MRTTVNVDDALLTEVRNVLGTSGVSDTINAAMSSVLRRAELDAFDISHFDISDDDVVEARRDRA